MQYTIEIPDGRYCNGCLLLRNDSFKDYYCMITGDGLLSREDVVKKNRCCPNCHWGDCRGCPTKDGDRKSYDPK